VSRVGIIVEGGLLAADLVERIALGDETVAGQKPKDFSLEAGRLSAEIQAAFSDLRPSWDGFKRRREFSQTSPVTVTREAWIFPLFERLGYTLHFQRAALQAAGQSFPISHRIGEADNATPVHAVAFGQKLDERGEQKRSPHALLQEYLNKSDALWGIVTNGRELRVLRNSARSSRPSYVAIDLETILDGNLYNEFALVFRLLHHSRLPAEGGDPHDCFLETWYQQGIDEGGRVRDRLRDGVKAALETLGSGFLARPANVTLCAKLDSSRLSDLQLYRELLNLIYRLLFLMVAEERRLLYTPEAGEAARHEVYLRWYGIGRLRDRAERRTAEDDYGDLWEGLKATFRLFRDEAAAKALALTALNGELFGIEACFDLEDRNTALRNSDLLDAIRQLSTFEERPGRKKTGVQRRVNYAGLDVEELGSIYESLLDCHPQVLRDPWRFALAAGSQRKETGSYYTPPELVRELIESALVPVLEARRDAAKTKEQKERALLSLTICDPAAGSGHFLLAAARRVGRELAIIRSGEAEPAPETYRAALRDVIRHCLYAVDKNPLAVDLCKVALWIEGHSPGLPLSFFDHRIRCGDSLIGVFDLDVLKAGVPDDALRPLTGDDRAVCAELRRINRRDRGGELAKFSAEAILAELTSEFADLADMPDATPSDVRSKEELYRHLKESQRVVRLRNACDAWTAAFFAPRGAGQERTAPTTADVWNALNDQPNPQRAAIIEELSERFHFFHWRLDFPEVFLCGGFDVMLGNPPWDQIECDPRDFFADTEPAIADAPNMAARNKLIAKLSSTRPELHKQFLARQREVEAVQLSIHNSGRFQHSNYGRLNYAPLFLEISTVTLGPDGACGLIVPTGIVADDFSRPLFHHLMRDNLLTSFFAYENEEKVFPGIANVVRFGTLTAKRGRPSNFKSSFGFYLRSTGDARDERRIFNLDFDELKNISADGACPIFRTAADKELAIRLFNAFPPFGVWKDDFGISLSLMFMMNSDSGEFVSLKGKGTITLEDTQYVPLYEGKFISHYDHRFGSYERVGIDKGKGGRGLPALRLEDYSDPSFQIMPRYWVRRDVVEQRLKRDGWSRSWLICWRDVTSAKLERTTVAAIIPRYGVGHTGPILLPTSTSPKISCCILANLNSIPFDFLARQKVAGTHLTFGYMNDMTLLNPNTLDEGDSRFVVPRVLELTYTNHELRPFAEDLGYDGPPFVWDPDRRALLRAELDAYFAYLYGLSREELRYILDPKEVMGADYPSETFRVLKENEIRAYSEYRTRRLVLEAWDRFAEDGIFDAARLEDPSKFGVLRRALIETRGRVGVLERERDELMALLKRSDSTTLPTLFVEGESDVTILTAAWQAFHPTESLPVTILAAGGTRQMESLAGRGAALRQLLGDRLVFALADNDREGRALVEDGRTRRGGSWRLQSNGIHWCLLAPTAEFEQAMRRFRIDAAYWPFTIENAFPAALRRQAIADGDYRVEEGRVQSAFLEEPSTAVKALDAVRDLDRTGDDAALYFRPPDPETKLAFAGWIAAPGRRDRAIFAAFRLILEGLRAILAERPRRDSRGSAAAK